MKLEPCVERFFAAGKRAAASDDVEELHEFRIAAKRLRYSIEILDREGGQDRLKRLRRVQQILGEMNDANVAAEFLLSLPSLSAAAKPLPATLQQKAKGQIAAFRKNWEKRFGEKAEKAWLSWAQSVDG